jgi:hypothetical protein
MAGGTNSVYIHCAVCIVIGSETKNCLSFSKSQKFLVFLVRWVNCDWLCKDILFVTKELVSKGGRLSEAADNTFGNVPV